jgi:M-phase inducer tyrosine phosphatase
MGHLFKTPVEGKVLLILYYEYSIYRAPIMARFIRFKNRAINAEYYPRFSYPEIYILNSGYSEFFK